MPRHATATSFGGERGNPTRPGPGNPGAIYRKRMAHLANLAAKAKRWETLLSAKNGDHETFFKAFDRVSDRAFGRPAQGIDHTNAGEKFDAPQQILIGGHAIDF